MFFRRKPLTLASLDERLSRVELLLELRKEATAEAPLPGPLGAALASLQSAITREAAKTGSDQSRNSPPVSL
jgi:hypothetical protein